MAAVKKKKRGHVAIPFLLALLVGIVLLGGIAVFIFQRLDINDINILEWQSGVEKPTAADNMTILFVLDEETDAVPYTFVTARLLPAEKKMVFICFPSDMLSVQDGTQNTLAGFYQSGGAGAAERAIESEAGIHSDRYVVMHSDAFQKIVNIFGGVYYQAPEEVYEHVGFPSAEVSMQPSQVEKLITYPFFEKGDSERAPMVSDIITEMINQAGQGNEDEGYKRLINSMETNFKTVINMVETDITATDYSEHEPALKYLYTYGDAIASFRIATGEVGEAGDVFILSSNFPSTVEDLFSNEEPSNGTPASGAPAETSAAPAETPAAPAENPAAPAENMPAES